MTISQDLAKVAARAKDAERRTAAAADRARSELEQQVSSARAAAQMQADRLGRARDAHEDQAAGRWDEIRRSWTEHVARVRADIEERRAEHDLKEAKLRAERAEQYAAFSADLAYSAIIEAEYAALDAVLVRKDAVQLEQDRQTAASGVTS